MTENQLFQAARTMQSMGSFAAHISNAFFVADDDNRETLVQAFKGLFERGIEQADALALAEAGRAIAEGCVRYEESQKTRSFILQVIQADGPCTLKHVLSDCKFQGITKGFVQALQSLKDDHLIETEEEDGETIVSLI